MPTYVYQCSKCRHRFALFHSITDESVKRCPRCRGRAARVPAGGAGILFKGSGFYITDYRSASYKDRAREEKGGGAVGKGETGGAAGGGGTGSGSAEGERARGPGGADRGSPRPGGRTSRRSGEAQRRPSGDA